MSDRSNNLRILSYKLAPAVAILIAYETFIVIRWLLFSGPEPALHDLAEGLFLLLLIWAGIKISNTVDGWLKRREEHNKEISTGLRDISVRLREVETRIEALYWGDLDSIYEAEDEGYELEKDLDESTASKIAKYKKAIDAGEDYHYHLGVTYWNLALHEQRTGELRKAAYWLIKATREDYDCENTLGDVYMKLQEYDKAMFWYRRSVKRGGSLVSSSESEIADMYAEGQGVPKSQAEAARWWYRSAMHGSYWSHYTLGKLYANGADGVKKDEAKAYFHLYIASFATGLHSPKNYAVELLGKVDKGLDEWVIAKQKAFADQWLATDKEVREERVKPLPLPE